MEFFLVFADLHSLNGWDVASASGITSPRYANSRASDSTLQNASPVDHLQKHGELSDHNSARNSVSGVFRSSVHPTDSDLRAKTDGSSSDVRPVYVDEISSCTDETSGGEDGLLDHCGILTNNCLPCLASTVPSVEKRRSLSSSPPNVSRKASLKLPFKWREGHPNATLRESLSLH